MVTQTSNGSAMVDAIADEGLAVADSGPTHFR
jgi:hypothetical protein